MTKQAIITALKDTCVLLDEKKAQFELMIQSLEKEEAAAEDEPDDAENDDAEGTSNEDASGKDDSGSSSEEAD